MAEHFRLLRILMVASGRLLCEFKNISFTSNISNTTIAIIAAKKIVIQLLFVVLAMLIVLQ